MIADAGLQLTVHDLLVKLCQVETWREIGGFPSYRISSWGRVESPRVDILSLSLTNGYLVVSLCRDGFVSNHRVNRLVAEAFLGPPPFAGAHAAHNDGNRENNLATNLRWTNGLDNQADVERHGNRVKGSAVFGSRLTESVIPEIKERASKGERYRDIADDFGVSISTVSLIKLGRIWRHV